MTRFLGIVYAKLEWICTVAWLYKREYFRIASPQAIYYIYPSFTLYLKQNRVSYLYCVCRSGSETRDVTCRANIYCAEFLSLRSSAMDKHLSTVSPTEPKRVHQASRTNLASSQSRSTVLRVRDPYPLARPDSFPIRAEGFVERRCSPWSHYRKTYRLRFGVNVWFTAAQQMNKPCDEVFVQELPAKIGKKELRHFLELRHPHIHTVLALFSTDETRFIVLEYLEVSLHEIATVGINTAELAALLGQVRSVFTELQKVIRSN